MGSAVTTWVEDRVLHVRLSAPERANSIDLDSCADLAKALGELGPDIGALALTAEGRNFCVGGDVRGFSDAPDSGDYVHRLADAAHNCMRLLHDAGVPVVIGAPGWSAGAGMAMLLYGDVVVLGQSSQLRAAYPGIAITPDCGMTWNLPRVVGQTRAREIVATNRVIGATEAERIGIATHLVADDDIDATVARIAHGLAQGPTLALRGCRTLLDASAHNELAEHLDAEAESIARHAAGPEGSEGITAFVTKRAPIYPRG